MSDSNNKTFNFRQAMRMNRGGMWDFEAFNKIPMENLERLKSHSKSYKIYTKDDILEALKNPERNSKKLRNASNYLYYSNQQYWRLVKYFAGMSPFAYYMLPAKVSVNNYDIEKIKTAYEKASNYLSTMNLRHEIQKAMVTAFKEDVFYGYYYMQKDSFYMRKLDADYCIVSSINDGVCTFAYDFTYFNGREDELEGFGEEFITKYRGYQKERTKLRWQELDNEFCIKVNEEVPYPVLPFAGTFDQLYELKEYKILQKAKSEIQNYKILGFTLPTNEEGQIIVDDGEVEEFYNVVTNVLPSNIGVYVSPYPATEHTFERAGAADTDLVDEATNNFMNEAGVSNLLFNAKCSTSSSLPFSITNDATIVYGLHRQIERNVNRMLKKLSGTQKFIINIVDCTYYNLEETIDKYIKLGEVGFPVQPILAALIGIGDNNLNGLSILQNEVLKTNDKFVHLQAGSTMGSNANASTSKNTSVDKNVGGRPKATNPTDSTIRNSKTK